MPRELWEWRERADALVRIGVEALAPFAGPIAPRFVESFARERESEHVLLLPSLRQRLQALALMPGEMGVFSRLEWCESMRRMAYVVYMVEKADPFDETVARMRERPWDSRWTMPRTSAWARHSLEWLAHSDKDGARSDRYIPAPSLAAAHPAVRLAWWLEERLGALLNARTIDLAGEWDGWLRGACLSVFLPKCARVPKEFVMSLRAIMDGAPQ